MRRTSSLLVAAGLALLLAACGGGTASSAPDSSAPPAPSEAAPSEAAPDDAQPTPGTALDACGIVTPADIEAAFHANGVADGTLEETPTTLSPGRTECTYEGDWGRVIVELTPEDGANLYDAARGSYDDAVDITGVGDGAFNSDGNRRAFVWQGSVAVMFTLFPAEGDQYDIAEALAKAVVAKL